jgi:hypothetical protein
MATAVPTLRSSSRETTRHSAKGQHGEEEANSVADDNEVVAFRVVSTLRANAIRESVPGQNSRHRLRWRRQAKWRRSRAEEVLAQQSTRRMASG